MEHSSKIDMNERRFHASWAIAYASLNEWREEKKERKVRKRRNRAIAMGVNQKNPLEGFESVLI